MAAYSTVLRNREVTNAYVYLLISQIRKLRHAEKQQNHIAEEETAPEPRLFFPGLHSATQSLCNSISTHDSARTPAHSINNIGSWEIEVSRQLYQDLLKVISVPFWIAVLFLLVLPEVFILFVLAFWIVSFVGCGMDLIISFHLVLSSLFPWLEWLWNGFQTCCLNGSEEDSLDLNPGPPQWTGDLLLHLGESPCTQDSRVLFLLQPRSRHYLVWATGMLPNLADTF